MRVPVRGIISRGAFPYGPVFEPKKKSVRTASAKMSLLLENGYCLEVQDDSLAPLIKKGTLIYVQQSAKNLNDGDLVVYVDPQGVGRLYLLVGRDSESLQLRSVSAAYPDTRIPAKHLPILDRVVVIFYP
jgi:phage repressor protein C with HTH and peptisase S24 domain